MNKAYQTNSKDIWIVNVGDIKPNEIGMNFFLDMAWNPDQFSSKTLNSYYARFAEIQFGKEYASEIGELLQKYFQLAFSRKPEHMGYNHVYPNTAIQDPDLSLFTNGDEVQARVDAYEELEQQAEKLYQELPAQSKNAFYEFVITSYSIHYTKLYDILINIGSNCPMPALPPVVIEIVTEVPVIPVPYQLQLAAN